MKAGILKPRTQIFLRDCGLIEECFTSLSEESHAVTGYVLTDRGRELFEQASSRDDSKVFLEENLNWQEHQHAF